MRNRLIALLLVLTMGCGLLGAASADVMTLGVYFRGLVEKEDGTTEQIPLSGSFRVLQGGLERGVIQAGESTLALDGTDPVTILPMVETIAAGWDLTDAGTTIEMADGSHVTVPILVQPLTEDTVAVVPAAETAVPDDSEETREEGTSAEGTGSGLEIVSVTWTGTEEERTEAEAGTQAVTTPEWDGMTPVPTAEPTPAPEVEVLSASVETGTFLIRVFLDSNNNGDYGTNEKGIGGIPVYLINEAGEVVTGGETGSNGEISLPGLTPGAYRVRVSLPEEYGFNRKGKGETVTQSIMGFSDQAEQESDPILVSAGETVERAVGLLKGVVVDGICWLDENADGIMQEGEPRIAGAHITLVGQKNGLSFEAYSDADGYWKVTRMRAGFYDFTSYAPEGMMFTRYSKTGGKNRSVFTTEGKTKLTKTLDLNDGKDELDQNIGFTWQASVSGIAFLDANYNGLYDEGEKPLAGVKVTAIKQVKEEEVAVAYTDENGRYTLGGLRANTFKIRAVLPDDGSNFTRVVSDLEGNHFEARSNRRENFWKDIVLADGESRTVNIGAIYYGQVSGTVYLDDDFSATMNGSEKTAQGISVTLLDDQGTAVATKQTNAKGAYSFTGLTPGLYSLRMTAKDGYAFTKLGEGNVMLNLNGGEGYSEAFQVPLGEAVTGMDAGMIRPATVKGMVFADENDNGRRDAEETGLAGTTVRLMSEEGEEFSATVTDSGEFLFDAVMPGRYYLTYTLPEGAIFAQAGGDNVITGEDGVGQGEWFDLRTADVREAPLCGGLTLGRISGTFFHDHDGSGTRDAGDEAMAGLRLILTPGRNDLETLEVTTGSDGSFELTDLHPDTWTLTAELPEGLVTARIRETTLPLAAGVAAQTQTLQVAMGQVWEDQRIGGVIPASLRGRVWLDENNDGVMDAEERTPAGLRLTITDEETGELVDTLVTDADGVFAHEGMAPGSYTVSYALDENTASPLAGDNTFRLEGGRMVMSGIALQEGASREDLVLGFVKYTSLGGTVWLDEGAEVRNLADAKVTLMDAEGNPLQTQTTAENGTWRFSGLMPGEYVLQAELPEGAVAVEPDDERLDTGLISVMQYTEGRTGRSDVIELRMGQDQLSLNMGGVLPGTIGDFCWLDLNGNGWQDGGELGIPHVKVELVRNGRTVAETETDQYGLYFFREVYPAVYTLKVTAPEEVKPTQKRTDIYLIVSSLLETEDSIAYTEEFSVASDSTDFNIDLGYVLRTEGVYPEGYGEQETQDWSKAYENSPLK